jgi:propionyl-CoA carboxylase alpha chain
VQEGERVYKGQELLIIESMKMETGVAAPRDAVVEKVMIRTGQAVDRGDVLFVFRP